MLLHHDNRDYSTAAAQAADWARDNLNRLIDEGRPKAAKVIEAVQKEQPVDHLVRSSALTFTTNGSGIDLGFGHVRQALHPNALKQAASKAGLPWTYAKKLLEKENRGWGPDLLARNLGELFGRQFADSDTRFLLRSSRGEVRGSTPMRRVPTAWENVLMRTRLVTRAPAPFRT